MVCFGRSGFVGAVGGESAVGGKRDHSAECRYDINKTETNYLKNSNKNS